MISVQNHSKHASTTAPVNSAAKHVDAQAAPTKPDAWKPAAISLSSLTLAACGGGTSSLPLDESETPWTPSGPPTLAEAATFLAQAGFGGTLADLEEVVALGFDGWITQHLSLPGSTGHVEQLIGTPDAFFSFWNRTMWRKLASSPDQLRQRLVFAWSQILVTSVIGQSSEEVTHFKMARYLDILDQHALGNFRELLEAVTLSTAMGSFLNMRGSTRAIGNRQPDENFAREIMQLFTIGLDQLNPDGTTVLDSQGKPLPSYDEQDVTGLAAVFTGWNLTPVTSDPNGRLSSKAYRESVPMVLRPNLHSSTEKKFLGTIIPANTGGEESLRIALDVLFNHPNTGPFIAIRLIQRLVTSNPVPAYVKRVARVFADNGAGVRGDMGAVVRAILLDRESRGESVLPEAHRGKLREPVLRLLQFCRTFSVKSRGGHWNHDSTASDTQLAQMPLAAPSVFNFYHYNFVPANSDLSRAGLMAPEFNLVNEPNVVGYLNFMSRVIDASTDFLPHYGPEASIARDADALVAQINLLLTGSRLSAETLSVITAAVKSLPVQFYNQQVTRVKAAVMLVMASPEYLVQKT